jgi:hypothetical protein
VLGDDLLTSRTSLKRFLAVPVIRRGDVLVGRRRPGRSFVVRSRSLLGGRCGPGARGIWFLRPLSLKRGNTAAPLRFQAQRHYNRPIAGAAGTHGRL